MTKDSFASLVNRLERDPASSLPELERFLRDADPKQATTRLAVAAMVQAGTAEVQRSLVAAIEQRANDADFLRLAVPTIGFLAEPTVATVAAVRALTTQPAPTRTQTIAHLALGNMASKLAITDAARSAALVSDYASRLASARTDDERMSWLSVLGNAGTPSAAAAIETQLDASDPTIRGRALSALRRVESPKVDATLTRALDDGDTGIRESAAWALTRRAASPKTMQVIAGKLATEQDDKVASSLLQVLWNGRAVERDLVVATMRSVAAGHASKAVRDRAQALLAEMT
ncbi:MAG TPA: HEAT repeat domain-containing protein [Kofleriaceae bacterium]